MWSRLGGEKGEADLGNDEIAVVERGIVPIDEDIVVAEFGNRGRLGEFEILETALAGEVVLFRSGW